MSFKLGRRFKKSKKTSLRPQSKKAVSPRIAQIKRHRTKQNKYNDRKKRLCNLKRGLQKVNEFMPSTTDVDANEYTLNSGQPPKFFAESVATLKDPAIQPCRKRKHHSAELIMVMIQITACFITLRDTITSACSKTAHWSVHARTWFNNMLCCGS